MIEYIWNIVQMDAYPQYAGTTDVVFNVHWTLSGQDGPYLGSVYGSQTLIIDPEDTFVPYENLTLEQVLGWVHAAMGAEQVVMHEGRVANQIQNQINPPVVAPPLPWN